ncbi:helix-turn-helix transcriptional regulator [Roseibium porphyridii]|uniref:helix-turn-helix transcriptional regulator n=1 Tax=Roseibium porphyridii TaxID=2866279 RepID=UPI003AAF2DD2
MNGEFSICPLRRRSVRCDCFRPFCQSSQVAERFDSALLWHANRARYRLQLSYTDWDGSAKDRMVWPLLFAFLGRTRYLVGWYEKREDFRHFKTDRIEELKVLAEKYPGRRAVLMKAWEEATSRQNQG